MLATINFDPVPLIYKYSAAIASFAPNRREWWNRYQWHPILQAGRTNRLREGMSKLSSQQVDVLLMWGSWFNPRKGFNKDIPFYVYIDSSCGKEPDEGSIVVERFHKARVRFNRQQFQTYLDCQGIFCMSNWCVKQTLKSHRINESKVHRVGWGPCSMNMLDEEIHPI